MKKSKEVRVVEAKKVSTKVHTLALNNLKVRFLVPKCGPVTVTIFTGEKVQTSRQSAREIWKGFVAFGFQQSPS